MTGIAEFLTARLDEDEATAQHSGPARVAWLTFLDDAGHMRYTTVAASNDDDDPWVADGHELVAPAAVRVVYDPARVLAEVAAQRRIIELHTTGSYRTYQCRNGDHIQEWQCERAKESYIEHRYCEVCGNECVEVPLLAGLYADHPDYDPSWRVLTTEENDHG